jgi:holo-[acyl-carrier protein] synthase
MARIEEALERFGERFQSRVAGNDEDAGTEWPHTKLARRWAVKEAVAKALGTGIGSECAFEDIVVSHAPNGALKVHLAKRPELTVHASVSDDAGYAVAFIILEK